VLLLNQPLFFNFFWRFIMKATRIATLAAIAISASAASMGAFAQNHGDYYTPTSAPVVSSLSRAQVQAEAAQAPRFVGDREFIAMPAATPSEVSRAEVRAEAVKARADVLMINNAS
jgi:hypothetical protein